jgi:hypothetical protein
VTAVVLLHPEFWPSVLRRLSPYVDQFVAASSPEIGAAAREAVGSRGVGLRAEFAEDACWLWVSAVGVDLFRVDARNVGLWPDPITGKFVYKLDAIFDAATTDDGA